MRIAYLVHDLSDPAVARRVEMLQAGGAAVTVLGFRRGETAPRLDDARVVDLGRTYDGRFVQRIGKVLGAMARPGRLRRALAGAEVVMARNLEMLALAAAARPRRAGLVYECLDVHRLMLGDGAAGRLLRWLERRLLAACGLLVVSSPAFIDSYFAPRQGIGHAAGPPVRLVENKVLELSGERPQPAPRAPGPPWRIGWYGALRCQRSLDILADLARRRPDLVQVVLRGRPARSAFHDFDAQAAGAPGLAFGGAYTPQDLPRLYGDVHFTWAVDWFEAGANSAWLLPNRIYEGGRHGAVPLALQDVETGRWLEARGLGVLMDDPAAELEARLEAMTPERYRRLAEAASAAPLQHFAAGLEDCRALVAALARTQQLPGSTQRDAHSGVSSCGTNFDTTGGGISCSDS